MRLIILSSLLLWSVNLQCAPLKLGLHTDCPDVYKCYKSRSYNPLWTVNNKITDVAIYAEEALKNAAQEGLNPRDYASGVQALENLRNGRITTADAEILFSKAFFKYVKDVRQGRFDPATASSQIGIKPDVCNPAQIIMDGLRQGGTQWIDNLPPQYSQYKKLKESLSNYPINSPERTQIIITMERWRWMPHFASRRYVLINIAFFELLAYENGEEVLGSPIIVGNNSHRTPVFSAKIYGMVFNPQWNVPTHITKEELLPLGPAYLASEGFIKTKYGLVQVPGPNNALGKVVFSINYKGHNISQAGIYLHDTPDQEMFEEEDRSLGHGCVRVQKVLELAKFVFNDPYKWPQDKIVRAMEGTITNTVKLDSEVPVFINYFTAWANDDGTVDFTDDVYGQDQGIKRMLRL